MEERSAECRPEPAEMEERAAECCPEPPDQTAEEGRRADVSAPGHAEHWRETNRTAARKEWEQL